MFKLMIYSLSTFLLMICGFVCADVNSAVQKTEKEALAMSKEASKDEESVTEGTVQVNGVQIPYRAVAGTMSLKDEQGAVKASVFYVAYMRKGAEDQTKRPITFCFNGGPGSSSVWLHMGLLGPKRVYLTDEGVAEPPYRYIDNDYSLLDISDLVFIDPVSTGYSRPAPGQDAKQFHGVEEDTKWCSEFVRLYTTHNARWDSPKFLCGESYGTFRAASMAGYLHDNYNMYLNGVILISSVLDFQTLDKSDYGNDLPFVLFLPSFTSAAWYHKKLPPDLQKDREKALHESEEFAYNEYSLALLKGDLLPFDKRKEIAAKLAKYTGLSQEYIFRSNLRVSIFRFMKELLSGNNRTIGRFDGRITGIDTDPVSETADYDPSADAIFGAFTATFNQYVRKDLKWVSDENYRILADVQPWDYGKAKNRYLNVSSTLRDVMIRNPDLKVFVANGIYDLATPYFGTEYTFDHLNLDPALSGHVIMEYYDAGHMMYTHKPSLIKLSKDLRDYIRKSLSQR